jgi:hypothetical protein
MGLPPLHRSHAAIPFCDKHFFGSWKWVRGSGNVFRDLGPTMSLSELFGVAFSALFGIQSQAVGEPR